MKNKFLPRTKHLFLFSLFFFLLSASSLVSQAQILSIDKLDYAPGETVLISGSGWTAGEEVILQVFNETYPAYTEIDPRYVDWSVYADAEGNFSSSWPVEDPDLNTSLVLTADGQVSGFKYKVFFTDASDINDGDGTMVVDVTSACAGLTGQIFLFTFTNNQSNKDFKKDGLVRVTIPTGWTAPSNSTISTSNGTLSFNGQVVIISLATNLTPSQSFTVTYSDVTVPSPSATTSYVFTTESKAKPNGGQFKNLTTGSPSITVNALPNNTSGSFTGNTICAGEQGILDFNAIDNSFQTPYTIVYSDGVNFWSQNITTASSTSFNLAVNPLTTTTYQIISITNGAGCSRTSGFGDATAQITVNAIPTAPTANNYSAPYDGNSHTATATAPSGSTVTYYDSETGGNVVAAPSGTNAGTNITVWAESISAAGCKSTSRTKVTLEISKREITITANTGQTKIYGNSDPLPFTYTVSGDGLASTDTFDGALERVAGETVGTYAINIGSLTIIEGTTNKESNYNISYNGALLTIGQLDVTVTAQAKSKTYGELDPALTFVSAPTVGTVLENGEVIAFSGALSRVAGEDVLASPYAISQGTLANSNYNIGFTGANLSITPKLITVTPNSGQNKVYGTADPALFTYTANPAIGSTLPNLLTVALSGSLTRLAGELVGNYAIEQGDITNSANPNYNVSFTSGVNFEIKQASTTTTLTLSGYQVRYMDMLTYTAVVKPLNTASPLEGSVTFSINGTTYSANVVPIPEAIDGSVQATVIQQLPNSVMPGNYSVTASFVCINPNYSGSTDSKSLKVDPKNASPYNATGFYVGDGFAWTTGPNTSTATVTMVAAIRDANTPSGDVRGAKVSFYFVNGTSLSPISSAQNLPVGLVNPSDGSVGTASAIVQLNIGSLNSQSFKIAVKITGGYTNNPWDALSETIVTVSKPVTGGFITGGSTITNQNSSGYIKGATGLNTDFQFDIQYTKSGTNPKGKVDIMVRSYYDRNGILDSKLHTYLIRTNAISLLAISSPTATGTFSAKANMNEQLEDGTLIAVESGAAFQMVAFQNACDQQIAITYYRKAGGVWFSSNWDAINAKSVLQPVNAGSQVYVAGGGKCSSSGLLAQNKSAEITTATAEFYFEPMLKAFPNPFTEQLNIQFSSATDTHATLEIFSVTGSKLQTLYNGPVKAGVLNTFGYKPRLVSSQIVIYRLNLGGAIQTGKMNYQERR